MAFYLLPCYVQSSDVEITQKMIEEFKQKQFTKPLAMGKGTPQLKALDWARDMITFIASEYYRYGKDQSEIRKVVKIINYKYKDAQSFRNYGDRSIPLVLWINSYNKTFHEIFMDLLSELDLVKMNEYAEWSRRYPEKREEMLLSESNLSKKINHERMIAIRKAERARLEDRIIAAEDAASTAIAEAAHARWRAAAAEVDAANARIEAENAARRAIDARNRGW